MKIKRNISWKWLIPIVASVLILILCKSVFLIGYVPTTAILETGRNYPLNML